MRFCSEPSVILGSRISAMLPNGFAPQGTGPLKVLIVYPSTKRDPDVRRFLRQSLVLPGDSGTSVQFST